VTDAEGRIQRELELDPTGPVAAAPQARIPPPPAPSLWARIVQVSAVPIAAVLLAFLVGSIFILVSTLFTSREFDLLLPFTAYSSLFFGAFGGVNPIVDTMVAAAPLILGGLAVGLGFKAGLFNIGAYGQFLMGALGAAAVGASVAGLPAPIAIAAAVLAGAAVGAVYGFIPGMLKAFTGAHEVVTTIMLNFIAAAIIAYLVAGPLGAEGFAFARTGPIGNAALPDLPGTRNMHIGVLLALLAVPIVWWVLARSTFGFEIRTVGANPNAARYAGMRPAVVTMTTMAASGLLAGLAGVVEILGVTGFINTSYGTSVGFDAISVALLGRAHPVGILFSAILFGAMRAGAPEMQLDAGIPVEIIDVLQGIILLFLAADILVRRLLRIRVARAGVDELQTVTRSYGEQTAR
jgi:general nucleoside transport system permease protein